MRVTILGGCGAWPTADQACSGYLVEHRGFRLVLDPGYASFPRLLAYTTAEEVDAVLLSHGHPDHCADLHALLRARKLGGEQPPPLAVYTPPGAAGAVLALDDPGMLDGTYQLREFHPGESFNIGPFEAQTRLLPHFVPNAGVRLESDGLTFAYTGDCGPDPGMAVLASGADLLLAEATYPDTVPSHHAGHLCSARDAAAQATAAGARHLVLTHQWPGTPPGAAVAAARRHYDGPLDVARPGLVVELG